MRINLTKMYVEGFVDLDEYKGIRDYLERKIERVEFIRKKTGVKVIDAPDLQEFWGLKREERR